MYSYVYRPGKLNKEKVKFKQGCQHIIVLCGQARASIYNTTPEMGTSRPVGQDKPLQPQTGREMPCTDVTSGNILEHSQWGQPWACCWRFKAEQDTVLALKQFMIQEEETPKDT